MCHFFKRAIAAFAAILAGSAVFAQVTTSGLYGLLQDEAGEPLAGATVVAVHTSSGTQYYGVANSQGRFVINGMRAGGPYTVAISFLGLESVDYTGVTLKLGEPYEINATLKAGNTLDAVVVVSENSFNANKTGAGDSFSLSKIGNIPTIDRSVYDVVKFTPQASVNKSGGISFAGTSIRYNSFQIDGAIANDAFGLSSQATIGGQTGTQPVSMDAIEEIQVAVAPFDVRQGGFTGGSINAITKSGTNTVKGSAYAYYYNQNLIGTTAGKMAEGKERTKYEDQNCRTLGFTVGAPIVKDKLFIFVSGEYYNNSSPNIYTPANGTYDNMELSAEVFDGATSLGKYFNTAMADAMLKHYKSRYGVTANDSYGQHQKNNRSINGLVRLDWNINDSNKLMFRYQLMDAIKDAYASSQNTYFFNGSSYIFNSRAHTFVAELNSRISDIFSNELRVTSNIIRDHRDPGYQAPTIYIGGDNVKVDLGTEYSSGANSMSNDTFTLTDNLSIFLGKHNLTVGTHNEFHKFNNVFIQYANGEYVFNTIADFFADNVNKYYYYYADPTVPGVDGTKYAATTYAGQFGLYVQDEWKPNRNFTLTYGVRRDIPILFNNPTENPAFNATEIAAKNNEYVGVTPWAAPLYSPRVGFRWYLDDDHTTLLRGGAGIFTGRVPFVWLSNAYNNTGIEKKSMTISDPEALKQIPFTTNPYKDIVESGKSGALGKQDINTLSKNFTYPQVLRANLGFDKNFSGGWRFTFDALFTKTLNNVFFTNLAIEPTNVTYAVSSDYAGEGKTYTYYTADKTYQSITALSSESLGYAYNFSGQLSKHFAFGLDVMASYSFGHSYSTNDGNSSVALSNWQAYLATDMNQPSLSYSINDRPHKINAVVSYTSPVYARLLRTRVSLTYTGASGSRYSPAIFETQDYNGDGIKKNCLLYVPTKEEIGHMSWNDPNDASKYEEFILADSYLNSRRGQFVERFGAITKFEHHFDFHIAEDFYYDRENGRKIELTADFMNISNLLNREWGQYLQNPLAVQVLQCMGTKADAAGNRTPSYKFNPVSIYNSDFDSRWRCQVGIRVTF